MERQFLNSKISGAFVTDAHVDYEGSISIDSLILKASGILPYEKVLIANLTNGARIESYAIKGGEGTGEICLNGGAALHGKIGDKLIIMTFAVLSEIEIQKHKPTVVRLNRKNEIIPQDVLNLS